MAVLDVIFNPVFQPLINISPLIAIVVLAFLISLLISVAYKLFTNQAEMKRLKEEQKQFQQKMKESRSNPDEMLKVQKEAMAKNLEYMKQSLKPTLITMLPVILIFGWMSAHLMFEPIYPGERFSITSTFMEGAEGSAQLIPDEGLELIGESNKTIAAEGSTWNLKGDLGKHTITVKTPQDEQTKNITITTDLKYEPAISQYTDSEIKEIKVNYNKLRPLGADFSIFGWQPGWLGLYLVFSIGFSLGIRKVLKIY